MHFAKSLCVFPSSSTPPLHIKPCLLASTSHRHFVAAVAVTPNRHSRPQATQRGGYSRALFMRAGGGGRRRSSARGSAISSDWVELEGDAVAGESRANVRRLVDDGAEEEDSDVPNTVDFNGETLTFGDYRHPSLLERCVLALAAVGPVGWKAFSTFRKLRRTWAKVAVAVVAPAVAWVVRSALGYIYRETVLQPKLRSPESVAFPNSLFEDVGGLKVHYLREDPTSVDGTPVPARRVLHMNHGFGASSSSWSPVIRSLSRDLGALAIAHDTPGFGLTGRVGVFEANRYSLRSNAAITGELVRNGLEELGESTASQGRCVLMGHSMGCITAATTALDPSLPPHHTTLVLVAPALSPPRKITAEQRRASERREAAAAAAAADSPVARGSTESAPAAPAAACSEDDLLRGGGGRRGANSSARGGVGAVVGAPASAAQAVLHAGVWLFNWCLLPMIYPLEILGLRTIAYSGNFWRGALRKVWVNQAGVDLDVINRYRWPTLVRYWDRGFALFLLDRLQIGAGGRAGPSGLVEAVAIKAAQGMKVIVIQGDKDTLVSSNKAKAIADAIPGTKLLVLPECGHVPHEEMPDDFLRLVLEHLSPDDGGGGGGGGGDTDS